MAPEPSGRPLRGVFAASLTPMTDALEPDTAALVEHVGWLLDEGCDGVAVLGTTGEANSLSIEQRLEVIEAAGARLPADRLMIGTGSRPSPTRSGSAGRRSTPGSSTCSSCRPSTTSR